MPRLNGKFVSKATYAEYEANQNAEAVLDRVLADNVQEDTMTDTQIETTETKTDGRHGVRPTTLLKRALIAEVNAEIALSKAQEKVATFEAKGQGLRDAAEVARLSLEDARETVLTARANV